MCPECGRFAVYEEPDEGFVYLECSKGHEWKEDL